MKQFGCDFCDSSSLLKVYEVPDSRRGMIIYICKTCGLVRSFQRARVRKDKKVRISSNADWGNIRHGKGLRLDKNKHIFEKFVEWKKMKNILDVGSSRGDFIRWVISQNKKVNITAIEVDDSIVGSYQNLTQVKLHISKVEDTKLPKSFFDFVYCVHTLEHVDSASRVLLAIKQSLRDKGLLFIEIPNIEFIRSVDIVEEFFIDKHNYHFDRELFIAYLKHLGFDILFGEDDFDNSNITIIARYNDKKGVKKKFSYNNDIEELIRLIKNYKKNLLKNRRKLQEVSQKLYDFMGRQKVAVWGAGRIFDALVIYGDFRTDKIVCLIDQYLSPLIGKIHGVKVEKPDVLRNISPDVIVILAKSSALEVEREVRKFGIRHVIKFSDLLNT